jgi:hypothetical protein
MGTTRSKVTSAVVLMSAFIVAAVAAQNASRWSECLRSGKIEGTFAQPLYGPLRLPDDAGYGAAGALAADYASLYFSAKDYLARSQMYDQNADPRHRPAYAFPPSLIFLTAYTTARLSFPDAALVSNFSQLILFIAVSVYFWRGGKSSTPLRVFGVSAAMFLALCTPTGVTWFERSQNDLYAASAILLLLKAMRDDRPVDFLLAGVGASFKWSCLPFFAVAALPYLVQTSTRIRRIILIGLSFAVPGFLLIVFGDHAVQYMKLVYRAEGFNSPMGISLTLYFPPAVARLAPFAVSALFVALDAVSKRGRGFNTALEPIFWSTIGLVTAGFGTSAYEYRLLSALFILPLAVDGRSILRSEQRTTSSVLGRTIAVVFLAYAFRLQTVAIVNSAILIGRPLVPLIAGMALMTLSTFWQIWRDATPRAATP